MKTTLLTFLFAATLLLQPLSAQETTYLPLFGVNKTVLFLQSGELFMDVDLCSEVCGIIISKDDENDMLFNALSRQIYWTLAIFTPPGSEELIDNTAPYYYPQLKVSEDNSKLWGIRENKEYLLMDLNLQVGDTYTWNNYYNYEPKSEILTVTNIYEIEGRKIIEFDKQIVHGWHDMDMKWGFNLIPFRFIEGVGCNFWDGGIVFVRTENRSIDYKVSEIEAIYRRCCFYDSVFTGINNKEYIPFTVSYSSVNSNVYIQMPEQIINDNVTLRIIDSTGKLMKVINVTKSSLILDIKDWKKGIYIFSIISSKYRGVTKFMKT